MLLLLVVVVWMSVEIVVWSKDGSSFPFALKRLSGACSAKDDKRWSDALSPMEHYIHKCLTCIQNQRQTQKENIIEF